MKKRLKSLDLLRGLDMLLLIGVGGVFRALPKWSDNSIVYAFADQFRHTEWIGFRLWDLLFPPFYFYCRS